MATLKQIAKFRPVLSADEIMHILKLAKRDATKESMALVASLARIEWQIRNGAMTPAYISTVQPTLVEDLGFDEPAPSKNTGAHVDSGTVSLEVLYSIWCQEPESLTAADIAKVRAWRYENSKMTVDEEKLFEREVLGFGVTG
jgi:hypothetical protein